MTYLVTLAYGDDVLGVEMDALDGPTGQGMWFGRTAATGSKVRINPRYIIMIEERRGAE